MNAEKFTQKSLDAVRTAKSMAEENRNNYITPEHLLYALVDQDGGLIPSLLGKMKVDCNAVLSELDTAIAALPSGAGSEKSWESSAPPPAYMMAAAPKSSRSCNPEEICRSHVSRSHGTSTWSISAAPVRETMYISARPKSASNAIAAAIPASPPRPKEPKNCHSSCPET